MRILRHLPEHVEDFMERIKNVLTDRHHGVLMAGIQLVISVVESDPKVRWSLASVRFLVFPW